MLCKATFSNALYFEDVEHHQDLKDGRNKKCNQSHIHGMKKWAQQEREVFQYGLVNCLHYRKEENIMFDNLNA